MSDVTRREILTGVIGLAAAAALPGDKQGSDWVEESRWGDALNQTTPKGKQEFILGGKRLFYEVEDDGGWKETDWDFMEPGKQYIMVDIVANELIYAEQFDVVSIGYKSVSGCCGHSRRVRTHLVTDNIRRLYKKEGFSNRTTLESGGPAR